ncbi:MAG: TIGR00730 family Rossman fold protein [Rhodobacteraceae bacterium]|nr:TIGR00730 family Rossman fold protein [Paracoccaceae bacterium]
MRHYSKSVCVYCGSSFGRDRRIVDAVRELGSLIAGEKWRLVYGAGNCGLMGTVADAAREAGGNTFGAIPVHMPEQINFDLDCLVFTGNMHERKSLMMTNSDAFIGLPGGFGTLEELFEVVTWRQIGIHSKPIHLLNTGGYWDPLITLMRSVIANGFAKETAIELLSVSDTPRQLVAKIKADFNSQS